MTEHIPMEISLRRQNGIDLLEVRGRLTIGEPSEQLNEALQSIVKNGGRKVAFPRSCASPFSWRGKAAPSIWFAARDASATHSPSRA